MSLRSVIRGVGSYLPARIVTNAELAAKVDTSDEWILERTGIRERHIAADGELTSDLAIAAAERAADLPASSPQLFIGAAMEKKLKALEAKK